MILAGICMIAPQQLRAEVPKTQMDGVMGQSIKEEMDDTQISDVDTQRDGLLSTYAMPRLLGASKASSGYTQDFLDGSFTSKVDYTSVTYYHKSDYEDAQLLNGIDVSWWQAKNKKTTASKSSIQNLEEVLQRFINNKNTFSLTEEENEMLKENLFELLSKVYDNYQLACIDINQIWVYETCYYTFTFESLVTVDRLRENIIATGCVRFMQNFTDGDGQFISFTKLDRNNWIYQLNFRIS